MRPCGSVWLSYSCIDITKQPHNVKYQSSRTTDPFITEHCTTKPSQRQLLSQQASTYEPHVELLNARAALPSAPLRCQASTKAACTTSPLTPLPFTCVGVCTCEVTYFPMQVRRWHSPHSAAQMSINFTLLTTQTNLGTTMDQHEPTSHGSRMASVYKGPCAFNILFTCNILIRRHSAHS